MLCKRTREERHYEKKYGTDKKPVSFVFHGGSGSSREEIREAISLLFREGLLVKVKDELYFHTKPYQELKERLREFFSKNKEITTQEFKDLTRTSRKYTIPLLEYFDARKVTIRVGDKRRLRDKIVSEN